VRAVRQRCEGGFGEGRGLREEMRIAERERRALRRQQRGATHLGWARAAGNASTQSGAVEPPLADLELAMWQMVFTAFSGFAVAAHGGSSRLGRRPQQRLGQRARRAGAGLGLVCVCCVAGGGIWAQWVILGVWPGARQYCIWYGDAG
jgi:hypothetical protein